MAVILEEVRDIALEAARMMGEMFFLNPDSFKTEFKSRDGTPVTVIDRMVGELIRQRIRKAFPGHRINEEESGVSGVLSDYTWYVDPLDGTSNVLPCFRLSCVGISVAYKGEVVAAAVGDPFEGVVTFGEKGNGVYALYRASGETLMPTVSEGRPWKSRFAEVDALFNERTTSRKTRFIAGLSKHVMNMRMFGSNILAASHLAQGRVDVVLTDAVGGFWDIAPAIVLVPEAGGRVTNIHGGLPRPGDQLVLATNGENHEELLLFLQECYKGYAGFR